MPVYKRFDTQRQINMALQGMVEKISNECLVLVQCKQTMTQVAASIGDELMF